MSKSPFLPDGLLSSSAGDVSSASARVEQARMLSLLYDIAQELTSILDLGELVRAVGRRVKLLVNYDLFSVMLLNRETGRLEHKLSLKYDQSMNVKQTLALGEGLCGTAAVEKRPIRVNRVDRDPRYILCEIGQGVQSELVIPLIVQDRVLGVLDLESLQPEAFSENHEHVLATLGSTIAIAIENACLYDALRRAEQRKRQDLERAREVQQLLLPKTMPSTQGLDVAVQYLPANELGGDFYDFLPYSDGKLAIAVGDVSGKGSAAALLACLGVGILREHAVHQPSPPADMLADLNGHLQIPGSNGRFIAMAFGIYDPAKSELCLASAGFPPPLLIRAREVTEVAVSGVPLGLLPDITYDPVSLALQPGDTVVFCSDGVHEQTNALEEEFGLGRLVAHLAEACGSSSAERIAGDIVRAIEAYAGTDPIRECSDDRTIVVLKFS
jgi:phosphoserine phosphatase RsbU/P